HLHAGHVDAGGAREHDGDAARQRAADRFVGLAPHDEVVPHRELLEAREIRGQAPRQAIVDADDAVLGSGDDERAPHTAMGALIAGCGSYPSRVKSSYWNS